MKKIIVVLLLGMTCICCTDTNPLEEYGKYEIINETDHILSIVVATNENVTLPDSVGLNPREKVEWESKGFTFNPFSNAMAQLTFYLDNGAKKKSFWTEYESPSGKNPYIMIYYEITVISKNKHRHKHLSTYHFNEEDLIGFK